LAINHPSISEGSSKSSVGPSWSTGINMEAAGSLLIKYWPAVPAALYLAYLVADGQFEGIAPAFATLVAALGLSHSVASAHARIDNAR
jgi:hypothetical protein